MAATTTTANTNDTNDMMSNTPPSTAAADGNPAASESVPKPAGDAAQTASGLPPITKEPMPIAGAFLAPTNPLAQTKAPTPPPEPAADAADTEKAEAPKNEAKDKLDTADKLAQQPPKPEESTANAASSAQNEPGLGTANGASLDAPKPVSVQEVQDEAMPAPATTEQTSEPVAEKSTVTTTVDPAPAAAADPDSMDIDQSEPEIGDKRKVDESEVASGADGADKSQDGEDEPAEKKLKTDEEELEVAPKKVGRPRKDKTAEKKAAPAPAPAGRTARRTRSQGLTTSESI